MVKMYRQPTQTSNQNHNDQTFCSALIDKIGRKFHKSSTDSTPNEEQKKESGKADKNQNELQVIVKKLKKISNSLPLVIQYSDAFGPGEKDCETCSMTKETYKKEIHHSRIVDKLVDGVIEKEQSDSIDSERSSVDSNIENKKSSNDKGDKFTLTFDVYCQGDPIKHNLKCILINLQQTIRDILVQIAFVKTRKLGNEERYRPFDVSVSDFKFLKYEYSNLIDVIVPLFNKPMKKTGAQVCVTCVKQKLLAYSDTLNEVLNKNGRDLKIVMRNENMDNGEGQCCARDYPHVHAEVQGKPIVLKYSLPIHTKQESPTQGQDPVGTQKMANSKDKTLPKESYDENWTRPETEPIKPIAPPYDEWPPEYQEIPSSETSLPVAEGPKDKEEPAERPSTKQEQYPVLRNSRSPSKNSLASKATLNSKEFPTSPNPSLYAAPPSKFNNGQIKPSLATVMSLTSQNSTSNISLVHSLPANNSSLGNANAGELSGSQTSAPPTLISGSIDKSSKSSLNKSSVQSLSVKSKQPSIVSQVSLNGLGKEKSISSQSSTTHSKETPSLKIPSTESMPPQTKANPLAEGSSKEPVEPELIPLNKGGKSDLQPNDAENAPSDDLKPDKNPNFRNSSTDYSTSSSWGSYRSFDNREANNSTKKVFFNDDVNKTVMQVATNECHTGFPTTLEENNENINHQNKNVEEVLRQLGKDSLIKVSQPAGCCQMNSFLSKEGTHPELPLCASLYSLPLDKYDLEYIAESSGKPISYNNITLESKENVPVEEYEWEAPRQSDPNNTRWLQAINDPQPSSSKSCPNPDTQLDCTECPSKKRKISSKYSVYIEKLPPEELPTIPENEPPSKESECQYLPHVSDNPSLPFNIVKEESKKRKNPSVLKHCEIRYFTVELTDKEHVKRKTQQNADGGSKALTQKSFEGNGEKKSQFKMSKDNRNTYKVNSKQRGSCESFHSCYSSESEMNCDSANHESIDAFNEDRSKKTVEELTMLSVIHLCDSEIREKEVNVLWNKPPLKSSTSILHIEDFSRIPCQKECKKEIDDSYVKVLFSQDEICKIKERDGNKKKSYTIVNGGMFCEKHRSKGSLIEPTQSDAKDLKRQFETIQKTSDKNEFLNPSQKKQGSVTKFEDTREGNHLNYSFHASDTNKTTTNTSDCAQKYLNSVNKKRSYTVLSSSLLKDSNKPKPLDKETFNIQKDNSFEQKHSKCYKQLIKDPINENSKKAELEIRKNYRKIVHQDTKVNVFKREKRKPLLLANPKVKYIRSECRVNSLFLTYPKLCLVEDTNLKIPQIYYQEYNICQNVIDISERTPSQDGKSYGPLIEKLGGTSDYKPSHCESNFGIEKHYISVKNNHGPALVSTINLKNSLTQQNFLKNTTDINPESSRTSLSVEKETQIDGQNKILQTISQMMRIATSTIMKTESISNPCSFTENDEFILIDERCKPLRLFNTNGRPLTDDSGRPLKTVCGESLIIFDKEGIPLSDWENNPVCDSLGKFMNDTDFNSETPWSSEILKCFTTCSGDPKRFYDVEGMPLTSVSGTMLVNASGTGLIRVNVEGKPVSDFRGRPLYDSNHNPF